MKNLLVEAARASKLTESTNSLSDSGSFDATVKDFAETANDPAVRRESVVMNAQQEIDSLQLDDELLELELAAGEDAAFEGDSTGPLSDLGLADAIDLQQASAKRAAAHIRYSPLICLVLAMVSATAWMTYSRLAGGYDASALGASIVSDRNEQILLEQDSADAVERFQFIEADKGTAAVNE